MTDPFDVIASAPVIIVVEDEELVRLTLTEALAAEGFQVIEAARADEALAALATQAAGVHVLVTDIKMPGAIDGLTLASVTREKWPWIEVLVTSGTPPDKALPAGSRFLPKPYAPSHVLAHLRDLLAA